MTYRGEIPGFYYDQEKGKYFRIQPNHRVPQNASHSRQNVKAEKESKKLLTQQRTREERQHHELVKRSLRLNLGRSIVPLRLGQSIQKNIDHVQSRYALDLKVRHNRPAEIWSDKVNAFIFSKAGAFCGLSGPSGSAAILCPKSRTTGQHLSRFVLPGHYRGGGQCMTIANEQFLIISHFPGLYTVRLDESGRITPEGNFVYILPRPETQIWDLASAPSGPSWALAGGEGLYIGDASNTASLSLRHIKHLRHEQRTVMFRDNNIVMSSERSGRINLTDFRVSKSTQRLQHSCAVNGIVNARNSNQLFVGGFSSVALYDLRFNRSKSRFAQSTPLINITIPQERAADQFTQGKQLVYSYELDIIAHATTRTAPIGPSYSSNNISYVMLYSGNSGKVLESPLTSHRFNKLATSIDLRRVRDGPESVWVLSGDDLQEWSMWNQEEDFDLSMYNKPSFGKYDAEFVRGIDDIYSSRA